MKKISKHVLFASLLALLPGSAFAWPTLGDVVVFDLTAAIQGEPLKGEYTISVTELDEAADKLTRNHRVNILGSDSSNDFTVKLSEAREAAAKLPERIAQCKENGGTPETVTTPAGTFAACKLRDDDKDQKGFKWIAEVPGGIVKTVSKNKQGGTTTLILRSFYNER